MAPWFCSAAGFATQHSKGATSFRFCCNLASCLFSLEDPPPIYWRMSVLLDCFAPRPPVIVRNLQYACASSFMSSVLRLVCCFFLEYFPLYKGTNVMVLASHKWEKKCIMYACCKLSWRFSPLLAHFNFVPIFVWQYAVSYTHLYMFSWNCNVGSIIESALTYVKNCIVSPSKIFFVRRE